MRNIRLKKGGEPTVTYRVGDDAHPVVIEVVPPDDVHAVPNPVFWAQVLQEIQSGNRQGTREGYEWEVI